MKEFIKKNQITLFFAITILLGWIPWVFGFGSIIMAAPLLSAMIVSFAVEGLEGLKNLGKSMIRVKQNWKWYIFIIFTPALTYLLGIGIHILFGGASPEFPMFKENQFMVIMTFIVFLIPWQSSAFLEEVGFRGYALDKLQKKRGPLVGTLILGLFFGAWLLPEFFRTDSFQYLMGGIKYYPWFIITEVGWSLIMTYVYNKTNKSAFLAGYLFHAVFNAWTLILLTNAIPGEDLPTFDNTLFIISGTVVLLVGIILAIVTKGKLGYKNSSE